MKKNVYGMANISKIIENNTFGNSANQILPGIESIKKLVESNSHSFISWNTPN